MQYRKVTFSPVLGSSSLLRGVLTVCLLGLSLATQSASAATPPTGQFVKVLVLACKDFSVGPPGQCISALVKQLKVAANGGGFAPNETVNVFWNCTDATCAGTSLLTTATTDSSGNFTSSPVSIPTSAVVGSSYVLGMLGATGDAAYATVTLYQYAFTGFAAPLDLDHTGLVSNTGKAGRTYPVRFQLQDNTGAYVTDPSAIQSAYYTACPSTASTGTDPIDYSITDTPGLYYDTGNNRWEYRWKTPSTPGCYLMIFNFADGSSATAKFMLS